jgi:glycosyltransferase involved in cell wall biosynthesis
MKVLSFIVPLYNSAKWLEKCLYSVLNQDIPESEMEIICVNDGSPDNSADMAREIGKKHPSIIVLDQENQGPSGARNTGVKHATGKYLCFVDPDDYVEPNVYGKLVQQMEEENLDMLRFNYQIVDEEYKPIEKREFEKRFDYTPKLMSGAEYLATRLDIACNIWRYMYRREIITENGIWCFTGDYYDDTPWLPLVLMQAERMNSCNTIVYDYLVREDSLVKTKNPMMQIRKTDGIVLLLKYLEDERKKVECEMLKVESKWKEGIVEWYKMIEAYCVIGLLTNVGSSLFALRKEYVHELSSLNILPLSTNKIDPKAKRKVRLANISPMLLVWMVHVKNV